MRVSVRQTPSLGVVVCLWAWRGVGTANLSHECESGCVGVCEDRHLGAERRELGCWRIGECWVVGQPVMGLAALEKMIQAKVQQHTRGVSELRGGFRRFDDDADGLITKDKLDRVPSRLPYPRPPFPTPYSTSRPPSLI
jgi:hypothetical protein